MEFLQNILQNSQLPIITVFILGLMTAISPCPLATNITAIAYLSKDTENRKKVFFNGLIYTLGRTITYTSIGLIFFFGASQFQISGFIQSWGEKILGPLLIIIGLFMLDILKIKFPMIAKLTKNSQKNDNKNFWSTLFLGILFALAFCPYSGVIYFGMLIPMTIASPSGLFYPIIFAIATSLPVIIFAWIVAFTLGEVNSIYSKIKNFELWFRRIVAGIFIVVGIYYLIKLF